MEKLNLQLKLLSPLVHTEETSSNIANIYREKCLINGKIEEIPAYHGNALRGTLRDLGFNHLLNTIDYPKKGMKLDVFHMLFCGGALEGSKNGLDIEHKGAIRSIMPLLSVLGSAIGNEMLEGKMIVSTMRPQCREIGNGPISHWDMIQVIRYTRQDDSKTELGDTYIAEGEEKKKQQMFYDTEALVPGTILEGEIIIDSDDPVEVGAFYTALEELQKKPYIGGASRVGHGNIEILNDINFAEKTKAYKDFLDSNKEEITEWINKQK